MCGVIILTVILWFNYIAHDNYKGLTLKANGDTTLTNNLDVGIGATQTNIKAHVYHAGSTGFLEMEARYRDQAYIKFETNYGTAYLYLSVKSDPYMYCGNKHY